MMFSITREIPISSKMVQRSSSVGCSGGGGSGKTLDRSSVGAAGAKTAGVANPAPLRGKFGRIFSVLKTSKKANQTINPSTAAPPPYPRIFWSGLFPDPDPPPLAPEESSRIRSANPGVDPGTKLQMQPIERSRPFGVPGTPGRSSGAPWQNAPGQKAPPYHASYAANRRHPGGPQSGSSSSRSMP